MQDESPQGGRSKKVHRSLENFDEYNITPPLLTSPRSLEACRRQGIEAEELVFRFFSFTPGESEQDSQLAPLPAHFSLQVWRFICRTRNYTRYPGDQMEALWEKEAREAVAGQGRSSGAADDVLSSSLALDCLDAQNHPTIRLASRLKLAAQPCTSYDRWYDERPATLLWRVWLKLQPSTLQQTHIFILACLACTNRRLHCNYYNTNSRLRS